MNAQQILFWLFLGSNALPDARRREICLAWCRLLLRLWSHLPTFFLFLFFLRQKSIYLKQYVLIWNITCIFLAHDKERLPDELREWGSTLSLVCVWCLLRAYILLSSQVMSYAYSEMPKYPTWNYFKCDCHALVRAGHVETSSNQSQNHSYS